MKNYLTILCFLMLNIANAQYFQQRYNLNYVIPQLRNERLNSGIVTRANYINNNPLFFYHAGIGTSYNNPALPAPHNVADRMRFIQLGTQGITLFTNLGYQFADANLWFNAAGNSIAEVKNATGTGGYVAVGAVTNNPITGANTIAGNSDILFTRIGAAGNIITSRRIDLTQGTDIAWCIRRSAVLVNGQPTWIICGESQRGNNLTDCFVARVFETGAIVWCQRFNFDPGGGQFNSARCIAKQLCEDANGYIYTVGTLQDNQGANGIDGLAFSLTPNGGLVWVNNYNAATDDEFQAVRLTANNNLIVGGFTNFGAAGGATHHMLITELMTANGAIIFQNVLRAAVGGSVATSKCYDIIETAGPQYYLAGPRTTAAGLSTEMMYRANAACIGTNWYAYNRMNYNVGFGLDNVNIGASMGVAYFSSLRDSLNANFSDAHIMKTDYNGRTCKFCTANAASNLAVNLQVFARNHRINNSGTPFPLNWISFGYQNSTTCNDAVISCPNLAMAQETTQADALSASVAKPAIKVFPNPVDNVLKVQLSNLPEGSYTLTLMSAEGKMILQRNGTNTKGFTSIDLDLSAAATGVYMLSVKSGATVLQQKIVKQ